jgi:CPA2 family monovalent cation:H+ antiporter-2
LLLDHWGDVLLVAAGTMSLKFLATLAGVAPFRVGAQTTAFTSLGMIPVGELNYIVAFAALQANVFSQQTYNLILAASLITIVLTPQALALAPLTGRGLRRVPGLGALLAEGTAHETRVGAALRAHAVVFGYGRVGRHLCTSLRDAGMPVIVVDANLAIVRELTLGGIPAVYGDATSATVVSAARVHKARLVVLALPEFAATRAAIQTIRRNNPQVPIIARGQDEANEAALLDAGANVVVVPELAGAATLLDRAMDALELVR